MRNAKCASMGAPLPEVWGWQKEDSWLGTLRWPPPPFCTSQGTTKSQLGEGKRALLPTWVEEHQLCGSAHMGAPRHRLQCCLLKTFSVKSLDNAFQGYGEAIWFLPQPPTPPRAGGFKAARIRPAQGYCPRTAAKQPSVPKTRLHFTSFSSSLRGGEE